MNKGSSLLEVTGVVVIMTCILSMIIANSIGRIQMAKLQKTSNEMQSIAQAVIDYLNTQGSCPVNINQLAPNYMPHAVTSSAFGTNYSALH